jgi:hypothetical protein
MIQYYWEALCGPDYAVPIGITLAAALMMAAWWVGVLRPLVRASSRLDS